MSNYGFSKDQVSEFKGFPLSECVDQVYLEEIQYVSGDNYEAIDFNFTRPSGERLRDRMFEVNENKIEPWGDLSLEDTIKRAYVQFNTRLWHIADAFDTDREELNNACTGHKSFKSFAQAYGKLVSEASAGKQVFVKTIRSKGGFINLPSFPNFIQSADKDCALQWTDYEKKQNEKNKRPVKKVEATTSETVTVDDDDEEWMDDV